MRATLAARSDKVAGALPVRLTPIAAARVITGRQVERAVGEPESLPEAVAEDTRADREPAARRLLDLARRPLDLIPSLRGSSLQAVGGKPA